MRIRFLLAAAAIALGSVTGAAHAATVYTSDSNIAHFDNLGAIGTFTDYDAYYGPGNYGDISAPPYTPTLADIQNGLRVIGDGPDEVVKFGQAYSKIEVLPNIDHFGSNYDGYQYSIAGCNTDCVNGDGTPIIASYTTLYDTLTVAGSGEPFTIGSYSGTAPYLVNNVLTPGAGDGGTVGYEAFYQFGTGYQYYMFGTSTIAGPWNDEQELTAVEGLAVPEPATWIMMILGFGTVGFAMRRKPLATA